LQFLPFRVGGAMLPLLGLLLWGAWAARLSLGRWTCWLPRVGAGALLLLAFLQWRNDLQTWRDYPQGGKPALARTEALALADAARWIQAHSRAGTPVLASPSLESVGHLAQRPVAVTYAQVPPGRSAVVAWFARIVAFAGGTVPLARGHALLPELDARFEALPLATYRDLARRYGGQVLLLRRQDLALPKLYRNAAWTVYAL